jgi:thiamine transport system permease protein
MSISDHSPSRLAPVADFRILAGLSALAFITLLIGGAFAGLAVEGAADHSVA